MELLIRANLVRKLRTLTNLKISSCCWKFWKYFLKYFLSGFITHFHLTVCVRYWRHFLDLNKHIYANSFQYKMLPPSFLTFFGCQYELRLSEMEGPYQPITSCRVQNLLIKSFGKSQLGKIVLEQNYRTRNFQILERV